MKAYVYPGQGAQFSGMGKDLYESNALAKELFEKANSILVFRITDIMFEGTDEDLKQTKVTQPAVFLHSVILSLTDPDFKADMVAGHSLGEFSALVANKALSFEDGLSLVYKRAIAMQKACEVNPSTMAAIIGLDDKSVEEVCAGIDVESDSQVAPLRHPAADNAGRWLAQLDGLPRCIGLGPHDIAGTVHIPHIALTGPKIAIGG